MSRAGKIKKRQPEADPVYNNRLVTKFVGHMIRSGQKATAYKVFYGAFDIIAGKNQDPLAVFEKALNTVAPKVEVRPRRVGGASYQVPQEVRGDRRVSLAIRWILTAVKKRPNKEYHTFADKLAAEFTDAAAGIGEAIKKRDAIHKMAEANRAFAHFRW